MRKEKQSLNLYLNIWKDILTISLGLLSLRCGCQNSLKKICCNMYTYSRIFMFLLVRRKFKQSSDTQNHYQHLNIILNKSETLYKEAILYTQTRTRDSAVSDVHCGIWNGKTGYKFSWQTLNSWSSKSVPETLSYNSWTLLPIRR
jgi:hypothetical protein